VPFAGLAKAPAISTFDGVSADHVKPCSAMLLFPVKPNFLVRDKVPLDMIEHSSCRKQKGKPLEKYVELEQPLIVLCALQKVQSKSFRS
jgi:hypothetical protein